MTKQCRIKGELKMKPIIRNHGRVFNSENWYMFYCGKCKKTINMNISPRRSKCEYCEEIIEWEKDKEK